MVWNFTESWLVVLVLRTSQLVTWHACGFRDENPSHARESMSPTRFHSHYSFSFAFRKSSQSRIRFYAKMGKLFFFKQWIFKET
ncbi:hypothetical protein CEXT_751801 [Caerostris extrusa]|uniref:Secreted protein n=1 Tax=Caerostris extrusa TaxID=172846 RepID=A0AAV4RWI9_CAEEX|nr:hypothetical protein CEXT_751801 [Caerostris extrusa]